jgi:hypothetical protein
MRSCSRSLIMTVDGIVTTMVAAEPVGLQVVDRIVASRPPLVSSHNHEIIRSGAQDSHYSSTEEGSVGCGGIGETPRADSESRIAEAATPLFTSMPRMTHRCGLSRNGQGVDALDVAADLAVCIPQIPLAVH